jgi:type I restriction enzyme R subunit
VVQQPAVAKPVTPRRLLTLDVHDQIDPTTREWVVIEADGSIRASTNEEVRAERLGIAFEAFLADEGLTAEQERLARMIGEQIRAQAAEMTVFELWRLVRPPFSLRGGVARAEAVFGGQQELTRFLARLNAALFGTGAEGDPAGAGLSGGHA